MVLPAAATYSIASILDHHAVHRPDRLAVIAGPARLTYAQLAAAANQIANGLRARSIQPGDHVALSCPNVAYFPMAFFGILKAGAVVVPLNVLLKPREIAYHLNDCDAKALLCFEGLPELPMAQMAQAALQEAQLCQTFVVMPANPESPPALPGAITLAELMAGQPPTCERPPVSPFDTALMLYTSGTTGQPKGAELTHWQLILNFVHLRELLLPTVDVRIEADFKVLSTAPLFHATALIAQFGVVMYAGGTSVLLPRFDPKQTIETMIAERINSWAAVPTMYWALLNYANEHNIDVSPIAETLKVANVGAAPMPVELMRAFGEKFKTLVLEGYGMSETGVLSYNQLTKPAKPGTVGQPLMGIEIRVHDENDQPVPTGTVGEIVVRGHCVMKGYYKRPEATAEAMRNGWFHTGDLGFIDEDGYITIVDRKKDLIIRGGYNVYPREIEEVMMTHPAVSLVTVIGVPDERLGEEVKAYVVRKPGATITEDELRDWCKEQMAAYKYPRLIEFRTELPIGPTGKVLKRALREGLAQGSAGA
jgi:long-chain acyl-CoA synthetase